MRKDYQKMQQEILPNKETQEWMWESIEKKALESQKKYHQNPWGGLAASVAAAVFVLVFLLPQTGLADSMKGFLQKYFYAGADVEKDLAHQVYEDSDGHVKMQIQELLSDGACIYFDICYEALDKEGQQWLANQEFGTDSIRLGFIGEEFSQSTGWSEELKEQEELATKKARYFTFFLQDGTGNFNLKNVSRTLFYPMYKSQGIGKIELKCNMDTICYKLVGEGSPSKFYQPKYLIVSKLSYGILGVEHGMSVREKNEYGTITESYTQEFMAEMDQRLEKLQEGESDLPISFTLKDGSKIDVSPYNVSKYSPSKGIPNVDVRIAAGYFNYGGKQWRKNLVVNPEELAGLDLDGVHYELVQEELIE